MASIKTKNNIGIEVWITSLTFNTHDETLQKALGRLLKTHFISEQSAKTSLVAGSAYAHRGASKTSISEICSVLAFVPSSLCQSQEVSDLLPAILPLSAALLRFFFSGQAWLEQCQGKNNKLHKANQHIAFYIVWHLNLSKMPRANACTEIFCHCSNSILNSIHYCHQKQCWRPRMHHCFFWVSSPQKPISVLTSHTSNSFWTCETWSPPTISDLEVHFNMVNIQYCPSAHLSFFILSFAD